MFFGIFALLALLAHGRCPCISASKLLPQDSNGCLTSTCDSPLQNYNLGCVNASYGSSTCSTWEQAMPACLVANPPSHCAEPWCYVNATLCRSSSLRYQKSTCE